MVELVYTKDLKSFAERLASSSLAPGTKKHANLFACAETRTAESSTFSKKSGRAEADAEICDGKSRAEAESRPGHKKELP